MSLHREGIAGVVFLILYSINLAILIYGFSTRLISFKSVYSFLLLHVVLRLAAQAVAIASGTKDRIDIGLTIAFFVLAAEGYFTLVLCAYRFLIHHHQHVYHISGSWLEGKPQKVGTEGGVKEPWYARFRRAMTARNKDGKKDPWVMTIIHWTLIGANTIIIVGGTRTTGVDSSEPDYRSLVRTSQAMRAAGQAIFLVINILLAIFLLLSLKQDQNPAGTLPTVWTRFLRVPATFGAVDASFRPAMDRISPDLLVLILAWPSLIIRGIFGLLQPLIDPINYASPAAYESIIGLTKTFVVVETVLSTLPEWTACCLLCSTMFFKMEHLRSDQHDEGLEMDRAGRHCDSP